MVLFSALEVCHASFPFPVAVAGWLRTLGTADFACLRIDTTREGGQGFLFLGGVHRRLVVQLADRGLLPHCFGLLLSSGATLVRFLMLEVRGGSQGPAGKILTPQTDAASIQTSGQHCSCRSESSNISL